MKLFKNITAVWICWVIITVTTMLIMNQYNEKLKDEFKYRKSNLDVTEYQIHNNGEMNAYAYMAILAVVSFGSFFLMYRKHLSEKETV